MDFDTSPLFMLSPVSPNLVQLIYYPMKCSLLLWATLSPFSGPLEYLVPSPVERNIFNTRTLLLC